MIKFAENLKKLRITNNVTQAEMAGYLGIKLRTYQTYEYGKNLPRLNNFIALADYFKVSLDELAGYEVKKD